MLVPIARPAPRGKNRLPPMNTFTESFALAAQLITQPVGPLWATVALSLRVSASACAIGAVFGLGLGGALAVARFRGRGIAVGALNTLLALPSVVVGLIVYLLLSRSGPLGEWGILFTPTAMVIAQSILVVPLIAALARQLVVDALREGGDQLQAMGARRIAVVSPYPDDLHAAGLTYWRAAGFDVIAQHRVETGSSDTRSIYGLGSQAALAALAAAKASAPDAVLLAGTGMPTLDLIEPDGHPPVISSNHCLAAAMIAHSKAQP